MEIVMPEKEDEQLGGLSGAVAGALAGASLGSAVLPVIGTFIGALGGGIVGSQFGRTIGGAILNSLDTSLTNQRPTDSAASTDVIEQLERLGKLREQGLITPEEFSVAKAKILSA
jgi:phage tail tape-measure protein